MSRAFSARMTHVAVAGLLGSLPALVWAADATAAGTQEVDIEAQAWYRTPVDTCELPIGCPPEPAPNAASTYPQGTLHIALDAGQPAAHAYLKPDLESVPLGAELSSGKLTLPLSEDPSSGNAAVATARVVGCLVTEPITDGVEGGLTKPPAYDCDQARSAAEPGKDAQAFTMDLAPFLDAWNEGLPPLGIALVPAPDRAPESSWQVTFNGKDTEASPRASVSVSFDEQATGGETASPPLPREPVAVPDSSGPEAPPPAEPGIGEAPKVADAPPAETGASPEPEVGPEQQAAAPRLVNMPWYTHGGVVYLPLALIAGIAAVARTLTRPVSPRPRATTIGSR